MANIGAARGALSLYAIGNSLTADSIYHVDLSVLSSTLSRYVSYGYHIRSAANLKYIQDNPTDVTLERNGIWNAALPGRNKNVFVYEPYFLGLGSPPTMATDIAAFQAFDLAVKAGPSSGYRTYIYSAWPPQYYTSGSYQTYWNAAVIDAPSTPATLQKNYIQNLYASLTELPLPVRVIPVGEVFNQIDIAARAGQLPGISTVDDFYRDTDHMGGAGRFVSATTWVTCLFGVHPAASSVAVAAYQALGGGSVTLTDSLAALLETIIWSTVTADSRTGVAS